MSKTKAKKTLSDKDIATYQRRTGPAEGGPGSDVDSDAHAKTDSDAAPAEKSDSDAAKATDKDA